MRSEGFLERAEYTLEKEIQALQEVRRILGEDFISALEILLMRKGKIIVTGVGKSSFVGMKIVATLVSLGQGAVFLHPVEALHGDTGVVGEGDVLLAISFSGESPEVVKITRYIKNAFHISVVSITSKRESSLGRLSDGVFLIHVEDEGSPLGLAPMASTTASLAVGDMIASALTSPVHFEKHHFAKFHPGGSLGLQLRKVGEIMTTGESIPIVSSDTELLHTLRVIGQKRFGVVGCVDIEGKIIGVLSDGDIRRFLLEHGSLRDVLVQDIMTRDPKTCTESDSLKDALTIMEEHKITSLFVIDEQVKPVGIIHMHAIVEKELI